MVEAASSITATPVVTKKDGMVTIKTAKGATLNIDESLFNKFEGNTLEYFYQERPVDPKRPDCMALFGDKVLLKNGVAIYYNEMNDDNPPAVITIKKDAIVGNDNILGQGIDISAENADRILIDAATNHSKDFLRITKFHNSFCDVIHKNPDDQVSIQQVTGQSCLSGIKEYLDNNYFKVIDGKRVKE